MGTSETLRSVIDAGKSSKRLDELSTARVVGKIAEQLHAAQQKAGSGKSVGPITPASITIDASGAVKIDLSQRGSALGYTAPEQLNGGSGDRRSDVFSLGVVMWEALTHQRLFEAMGDAAVKLAVAEREIKSPVELNANIPAELSAMCMKALTRNPADRYQSAKVMSVEIEEFLSEAGYEDSAAPLVGFLADMQKAPRPTLLPPSILKSMPPVSEPEKRDKAQEQTKPLPSGLALASALAKAETKPVEQVPAPPKLPEPVKPTPPPVQAAEPAPAAPPAKPEAAAPSAIASSLPPIDKVAAFAPPVEPARLTPRATIAAAVPPPAQPVPSPLATTVPDLPRPPEPADDDFAPEAPQKVASAGSQPTQLPPAAAAVSLPKRAHRDSENVLNNWAWQTDSVEAIHDEHEDFHPPPSRKPLYYVIGGGFVLATIVTIIAVGFGSSDKPKQPAAAAQQAAPAPAATPAPTAAPEAAPVPPAATPTEPPKPEVAATPPPAPEPPKPEAAPAPAPEPPKAEPPKPEPPKPEPPKAIAKAEPPPKAAPPPPAPKAEPKKAPPAPKAEPAKPKTIAKAEPKKPEGSKLDVEAAYRQGLQQFARGDTQGALASLRTSLAGNPNYAPTWRGLGLVFEKMGEKDQARAAYKRYLQLAPSAGDAEQIRSRMERLGS